MNESTQPAPVAAIPAPMRHLSQFLTLEYVAALVLSLIATLCVAASINAMFAIWGDVFVVFGAPLNWLLPITSGYVGAIVAAIGAVVTAGGAFILFGRVSRTVSQRPGYTGRISYKLATYGALAAFALQTLMIVIGLVGIVISSLMLIGSESSIGELYLQQFLPLLLGGLVVGSVTYLMYKITKGFNKSKMMTLVLVGAGSLALVALIVTVAVAAHNGHTFNDFGRAESASSSLRDSLRY